MHLTKQAKDFVRQKFPHLSDSDKNQLLDDFKELKIPVREDGVAALTAIQVSLLGIATTNPSAAQIKEMLIKTKEGHVKSGLTEAQVKENSRMLEKSEAARQDAEQRAEAAVAEIAILRRQIAAREDGDKAAKAKQPIVPSQAKQAGGLLDVAGAPQQPERLPLLESAHTAKKEGSRSPSPGSS